jgi:hypothetical protein
MVSELSRFRQEDSGAPLLKHSVDRIIDNVVFLMKPDPCAFWSRVMGTLLKGQVPASTARSFIRSLLFMFEDSACYALDEQKALFENAMARVELASGGFAEVDSYEGSKEAPNLIRGWIDDAHLGSLIRCMPFIFIVIAELARYVTFCTLWMFGWKRGPKHASSGLECWVYRPKATHSTNLRPLVLIPGAGFGLTSFLPVAFLLQKRLTNRTIILYRLPWVEVCHPWAVLPQWSAIIGGILTGLADLGMGECEIDLVSHSYGTAVANRLLRELCAGEYDRHTHPTKRLRVHFLGLLDPIVLGGATTGLSGCSINQAGPDISFGFCGNRAGHSTKEVMDYDPRLSGQCTGGIGVYMSGDDILADAGLARYVLEKENMLMPLSCKSQHKDEFVQFYEDSTVNSFHGRWLVEIWSLGLLWDSPCASACMGLLYKNLQKNIPSASFIFSDL